MIRQKIFYWRKNRMQRNNLMLFTANETYGEVWILDKISKKDFQECLDEKFFEKVSEDKYRFTDKGQKFAWGNEGENKK